MGLLRDSFKESGQRFDKVRGPEETLNWVFERFSGLDAPVLEEVRRIDKGRLGIPVYVSRYAPWVVGLTGTAKQMGKGITAEQAKASAVMELVERFSLFSFVKHAPKQVSAYHQVGSERLDLQDLYAVLETRVDHSKEVDKILLSLPMEWVNAYSPSVDKWLYLPLSWFWPINEYNGSAAGNSLEEASVQALCEVIERHVCSLVTYDRLQTPEIDLASIPAGDARDLVDRFVSKGIKVILKDFSLGIGVPTVGAICWDPSTYPERSEIVYTAGTAPNPERALIRALTEVAQLAGDFDTDGRYVESGLPKFATLDEAEYVLRAPEKVPLSSLPDCGHDNFRIEVLNICKALKEAGFSSYLLDITHPELGVPAVYAVVPGNQFRDRTRGLDLPFHCARIAATSKDVDQGLVALEAIYSQWPRFDVAFYLGHAFEQKGLYEQALSWYQRSLELDPDPGEIASIHCHRGLCLKEMGEFDLAIKELEAARKHNPGLKEIHNLLGFCLYKKSRHLEAIQCFEKAIEIDPGSAVDYANIASNLNAMGMGEAALVWYKMALEIDPGLKWAQDQMEKIMNSHSTSQA